MNALKKFFISQKEKGFPSINLHGPESRFEIDMVSATPPIGARYRIIVWTDESPYPTTIEVRDFTDEISLRRFLESSDQAIGYSEHCEQCANCGHYDNSPFPSYHHDYKWNREKIEEFIQSLT